MATHPPTATCEKTDTPPATACKDVPIYQPNPGEPPCAPGSYKRSDVDGGGCLPCKNINEIGTFCPDGFNSYITPTNTIPESSIKTGASSTTQCTTGAQKQKYSVISSNQAVLSGATACIEAEGCRSGQFDPFTQQCVS